MGGGKALAYFLWRSTRRWLTRVNGMAGLTRGHGRLKRLTRLRAGYALAIGVGLLGLVTYLFIVLPK